MKNYILNTDVLCFTQDIDDEKNVLVILLLALFVNGYAENVFFTAPAEFIVAIYISLIYRYLLSRGEENISE